VSWGNWPRPTFRRSHRKKHPSRGDIGFTRSTPHQHLESATPENFGYIRFQRSIKSPIKCLFDGSARSPVLWHPARRRSEDSFINPELVTYKEESKHPSIQASKHPSMYIQIYLNCIQKPNQLLHSLVWILSSLRLSLVTR
jgi:hypothetical protein